MRLFLAVLRRELLIAYRNSADLLNPLIFFVIVISLFPLGVSPSGPILSQIAPGVILVAALLATLLSMDSLFRSDYDDGSLELMTFSREPLVLLVLGKIVSHWLVTGVPLAVLSPVLALMLFLNFEGAWALFLSLILGTPILNLLGAIGASLTVGLRKGGLLIAVLILPLYVPVLILATAMVQAGAQAVDYTGHMLWLGAILAASIGFAPIAASAGVRISLSR